MATNVTFYRGTTKSKMPVADGAISFNTSAGGIYVGDDTSANEVATKVSLTSNSTKSGLFVAGLLLNNTQYSLYAPSIKGWKNVTADSTATLASIISEHDPSFILVDMSQQSISTLTGGLVDVNSGNYGPVYVLFYKRYGSGSNTYVAQVVSPKQGFFINYYLSGGTSISASYAYINFNDSKYYTGSINSGTTQSNNIITNLNAHLNGYTLF